MRQDSVTPKGRVPAPADDDFDAALAAHRRGDLIRAKQGYDAVIAADPDHVPALQMLGSLALQTGHRTPALALFERVVELRPDVAESHNNLASALVTLGRYKEALKGFSRAAALDPTDPTPVSNMGVAFLKLGRADQALLCQKKAVAIDPDYALGHQRLGEMLDRNGEVSQAVASLRRAMDLAPPTPEGLAGLGSALLKRGEMDEAVYALREAARLLPDHPSVVGNLCLTLLYGDRETPESLWEAHRGWAARFGVPPGPVAPHRNDRDPYRRLRVGYVSPDMREHSVAHFLEPLLASHDRDQVAVFAYSELAAPDARTARFKALCDGWRDTVGVPDNVLAEQVRADEIDVLVDLAGHFNNNRLTLFSRRPAPVQVSWLGYPTTTGLDLMDARISDGDLTPPDGPERWSESLVRLPRPYLAYQPQDLAPDVGPPPCLAAACFTFGSFNNLSKVGPVTIALWARVLAAVPGSRLLLKSSGGIDPGSAVEFSRRFAPHGVDPDRVEVIGWIDDPVGHLGLYRRVDVGLDPHPYNGTTTTCEALWMGVPVISLAGDMARSRNGVTLLRAVGLPEFVAEDPDDYVGIAARWAGDPHGLSVLRSGLRDRMATSPLCDAIGFARAVEGAYRDLWIDWLARQSN